MAFGAAAVWRVINGGADGTNGNGGGFDPSVATNGFTDGAGGNANTASPTFSSASYNFVAGDVGAWLFIASGTNCNKGWYKIASVAGGAATLSAAVGAATLYPDEGLNTVAGFATVASPTSISWVIDYSLQTAAQIAYTDIVIDGTTNTDATSAAHPFGKQMVGNVWAISAGTGFTVQRVVLSSIVSGKGRFDKSLGTLSSTGGTGNMGGAYATPGYATIVQVAGNTIWLAYNATPYPVTSTTASVTGGRVSVTVGTGPTTVTMIRGYDQVPGDDTGNRPTIQWQTTGGLNSAVVVGNWCIVENIIIDGNRAGSATGRALTVGGAAAVTRRVKIMNCNGGGLNLTSNGTGNIFEEVEITNCTSGAGIVSSSSGSNQFMYCTIHDNVDDGCAHTNTGQLEFFNCIFSNNIAVGAKSAITSSSSSARLIVRNCDIYGCGSHGISLTAAQECFIENTHFENNGGYGVSSSAFSEIAYLLTCSFYANSSGQYPSGVIPSKNISGTITCSGSAYTNAAGNDFTKNSTAGAGALVRGSAIPSSFAGLSTNNYRDVGASQHQDAGGGVAGYSRARVVN